VPFGIIIPDHVIPENAFELSAYFLDGTSGPQVVFVGFKLNAGGP
jgi:hypothetical protein